MYALGKAPLSPSVCCEDDCDKYNGCTIFQDAIAGIIWVKCQVSLGAGEAIVQDLV
jgi:hypothetical protein